MGVSQRKIAAIIFLFNNDSAIAKEIKTEQIGISLGMSTESLVNVTRFLQSTQHKPTNCLLRWLTGIKRALSDLNSVWWKKLIWINSKRSFITRGNEAARSKAFVYFRTHCSKAWTVMRNGARNYSTIQKLLSNSKTSHDLHISTSECLVSHCHPVCHFAALQLRTRAQTQLAEVRVAGNWKTTRWRVPSACSLHSAQWKAIQIQFFRTTTLR